MSEVRNELAELRALVADLQARVRTLELSDGPFELVDPVVPPSPPVSQEARSSRSPAEGPAHRPAGAAAVIDPHTLSSELAPVSPRDIQGRQALARQVGRFLLRALSGDVGATSGRDRLRLRSRVYLVLAGHNGAPLPRPVVCHSFAPVARLCKVGSSCGRSVFAGFATSWEARLALEEAGFTWLTEYE